MRNSIRFQGVFFRINSHLLGVGLVAIQPRKRFLVRDQPPTRCLFLKIKLIGDGHSFFDFCRSRFRAGDCRGEVLLEIRGRIIHFHGVLFSVEADCIYFQVPLNFVLNLPTP